MATSKQLEANRRSGRNRAQQNKRSTAKSQSQKQAAARRKERQRQDRHERVERAGRMEKYWRERRLRWEAEMRDITRHALPNYNPMEDPHSTYRIQRVTVLPSGKTRRRS